MASTDTIPETESADGVTFRTHGDAMTLQPPPADGKRTSIDYRHELDAGFYVRVMRPNKRGEVTRSWVARFTDATGKKQKKAFALVSEMLMKDARRKAEETRDLARDERKGIAPVPVKIVTLRDVYKRYIGLRTELSDTTLDGYADSLKRLDAAYEDEVAEKKRELDEWRARLAADPTRKHGPKLVERLEKELLDLERNHDPEFENVADRNVDSLDADWWARKYLHMMSKHGIASAKTSARLAHALYGAHYGNTRINPLRELKSKAVGLYNKSQPKQRIIPRKQLKIFWNWLHTQAQPAQRDFMLMALFTALRSSVIAQLRWENVNMVDKTYYVPADERGNKSKRYYWMPIPEYIYEKVFLPRYAARGGSPWVLSSPRYQEKPLVSIRGTLEGLFAVTGIHVSPHDLRRTFSTLAHQLLKNTVLVGRMLTHSLTKTDDNAAVTSGYIVHDVDDLREGYNTVAAYIIEQATAE